ncbi:MAG: hypothetical protein IPN75_13560 [Dechloromonas sp.]|uniref:Glutamate synthase domain-containing protein n=1 Tax=Candidatus Dechloromonas phosphorivorans TaxID=2899244 RepID=A0A9D7QNT3_9RHOO|nr:hypothetical protein [Candidatus Dechloromonas phosphorivorans]
MAAHENVRAFEIKLSQGAKPGKGGVLPAASHRGNRPHPRHFFGKDFAVTQSPSGNRQHGRTARTVERARNASKPVGIKTAIGGRQFRHQLVDAVHRRGQGSAPDFPTIDGGEGGSGAAPQALADHMAMSINEALPRVVDALIRADCASGSRSSLPANLGDAGQGRRALACGADSHQFRPRLHVFARLHPGAARCHRTVVPPESRPRPASAARSWSRTKPNGLPLTRANLNKEVEMIAHACGLRHARQFRREHVRIVQPNGQAWRSTCFTRTRPFVEQPARGVDDLAGGQADRPDPAGDQPVRRGAMQMDASEQGRFSRPAPGRGGRRSFR